MAQRCRICDHAKRRSIDHALLAGRPKRQIALRYGLSYSSLRRHLRTHLAKRLERITMLNATEIGKRLTEMDATAADVLAEDRVGDHRVFWQGLDARSRNLERLYKLSVGAELESRIKRLEEGGDVHGDRGVDPRRS